VIAFLDTSALIYLVEGRAPFSDAVRGSLRAFADQHRGIRIALSRLTWLECRVRPLRTHDSATLAAYDAFFQRPDLVWVELTREVVELATAIRAHHGLRTPDALQAASCLQLGPRHVLLSGDAAFRRVRELTVEVVPPG
jgi:predicted nucleic acid-binding protein